MARKLKAKLELDTLTANRSVKKVSQSLRDVGKQGKKAGDEIQGGIDKGTSSATRFIKTFVGVGAAVGAIALIARQLRAEYAHLVQQQKRAAQTQVSVGHARAAALYNLPGGMSEDFVGGLVASTAEKHKLGQGILWNMAGSMLSSKGSLSQGAFAAAFGEAARMRAVGGPAVDASTLGGGLQDIMRATGVTDPRAAGGWVRQIGQQSRVVQLGQQFRNIVPVVAAAKPSGFSPEQAAELFAYLTQRAGDVTGEQSRTGAINFMKYLSTATTKGGLAGLRELQEWYSTASPGARKAFAAKLPAEAAMRGPILSLIARESGAMADWQTVRAGIMAPTAPGAAGAWESYYRDVGAGRNEPVRTAKRTLETFIEHQELTNPQAMAGIVRDKLVDALRAIPGISDAAIEMAKVDFELKSDFGRGDVIQAAMDRIKAIQRRYGYGMPRWKSRSGRTFSMAEIMRGEHRFGTTEESPLTYPNPDYDPERAGAIQNLIEGLEGLGGGGPAQSMAPTIINNIGVNYGNTQRGFALNDFTRDLA